MNAIIGLAFHAVTLAATAQSVPDELERVWLVAGLVLAVAVVAASVFIYRKVQGGRPDNDDHADAHEWPLPPLIVPPGMNGPPTMRSALKRASLPTPVFEPPARPPEPEPVQRPSGAGRVANHDGVDLNVPELEHVEVGRVRFHRPPEGTLQLLPGRLEILAGNEQVEEIRFVKLPGREPVVTFGRNAGEPHTHVQLQSPTVSRMHAVMRFQFGRWHIVNLSQTNPVHVRGVELPSEGTDPIPLEDGDELEMGEVTFRFRLR